MNSRRIKVVLGSILGAIFIQVALVVCSGGGSGRDGFVSDGTKLADAAPSSECLQWQVQGFVANSFSMQPVKYTNPDGTTSTITLGMPKPFDLPEGWEPYSGQAVGTTLARKCIKR